MSIKSLLRPVGLLVILLVLIVSGLTISSNKANESASKLFIKNAQTQYNSCVQGKGSPLVPNNPDLNYVYCISTKSQPDLFFVENGGNYSNLNQENELGAQVLFTRGDSKDLIGVMSDPVSLENYLEIKSIIKQSDKIVFDPAGIGERVFGLAGLKGSSPAGLIWTMPKDFSLCSFSTKCIELVFYPDLVLTEKCSNKLSVELIWLNGKSKIERTFTEIFPSDANEKEKRLIIGTSQDERTLQILGFKCSS